MGKCKEMVTVLCAEHSMCYLLACAVLFNWETLIIQTLFIPRPGWIMKKDNAKEVLSVVAGMFKNDLNDTGTVTNIL